jgi:ribose 5-phosphate isomerase A
VDGADEIDPSLTLIKGLGGALLREKIVAAASERMVVIATDDKLVERLGARAPLPVEVSPVLWELTSNEVARLGVMPTLRATAGEPFVTDNGNLVIDCRLPEVVDPSVLGPALDAIPGVLGHGLFVGLASLAIVAGPAGVRVIERA